MQPRISLETVHHVRSIVRPPIYPLTLGCGFGCRITRTQPFAWVGPSR
jgi:hypothetical protein